MTSGGRGVTGSGLRPFSSSARRANGVWKGGVVTTCSSATARGRALAGSLRKISVSGTTKRRWLLTRAKAGRNRSTTPARSSSRLISTRPVGSCGMMVSAEISTSTVPGTAEGSKPSSCAVTSRSRAASGTLMQVEEDSAGAATAGAGAGAGTAGASTAAGGAAWPLPDGRGGRMLGENTGDGAG